MILTNFLKILSSNRRDSVDYDVILPKINKEIGIPKLLFQICLRNRGESSSAVYEDLPQSFKDNIEYLKLKNAGWTYQLISDCEAKEIILEKYGSVVLDYYYRINPVYGSARADFLKSLLLYAYGGVYIDLKSTIHNQLDNVILPDDQFLLMFWDNVSGGKHHFAIPSYIKEGEIIQGFIVSCKGHEYMREVIIQTMKEIDNYNPYVNGVGFGGVMSTVGPGMYTKTLYERKQYSDINSINNYRLAKPFHDFDYNVSFWGEYSDGAYQEGVKMSDYRKNYAPVIIHHNCLIHFVNKFYLRILNKYRR